jgi:two-component system alkaline phosphatase synthesis response regulator PhoP
MPRVLIVDDHQHTHRLLQAHLARFGMEVLSATDGEQGLAMAIAERPDLIILDVTMPRMGGREVLRTLKSDAELRAIPVVMLTALTEDDEVADAMQEGADYYLPKPFHPLEVSNLVRQVLTPPAG